MNHRKLAIRIEAAAPMIDERALIQHLRLGVEFNQCRSDVVWKIDES